MKKEETKRRLENKLDAAKSFVLSSKIDLCVCVCVSPSLSIYIATVVVVAEVAEVPAAPITLFLLQRIISPKLVPKLIPSGRFVSLEI